MKIALTPLSGTGEEWWKNLTPDEKHYFMWPRFEAGHSNPKIVAELGVSLGVVAGQRQVWCSKNPSGRESTEGAAVIREKRNTSRKLFEENLRLARQAHGPPIKPELSPFPAADAELTEADIRALQNYLYENA